MDKIKKLAKKFEQKLFKLGQNYNQEQLGTTELFFDNENKQKTFAATIQSPQGLIYKILSAAFNKSNGGTFSFDLKITADPHKGAAWILNVEPGQFKNQIYIALDTVYKSMMGISMADRAKLATAKAKTGAGSGTLNVGSLELT